MVTEIHTIKFHYRNKRDEITERTVQPMSLDFNFDPPEPFRPGWCLTGFDVDKQAVRSFFLERIRISEYRRIFRLELK